MNAAEYMARAKQIIDDALERELPPESEEPVHLHKAMRYAVFPGGKRIRPILCLVSAEAVGGSTEAAVLPAVAIELVHSYTLVHDDLPCMDDDDFRRGRPSCHAAFGEAQAVLAGDALQSLAFEVLGRAGASASRLVEELAAAIGSRGVAGGQSDDISGEAPDEVFVEKVHYRKTALLFRAAARMGAIAGAGGGAEVAALTEYGLNFGLAFQIYDDMRDFSKPCSRTWKAPGRTPEVNCVQVYGEARATLLLERHVSRARAALGGLPSARRELLESFSSCLFCDNAGLSMDTTRP